MGPYERLCRMLDIPVPEASEIAKHETAVALWGRLGVSEEQVQSLIARIQGDPELLARFRATAPPEETIALYDVATTLLAEVAAEEADREAAQANETEGDAADDAPWDPAFVAVVRSRLILGRALADLIAAIDRVLAGAGGAAEATVPAAVLLGLRERAEAAFESAAVSIASGGDADEPADRASAPGAPTSLD